MSGWQPIETAPKDGTWILIAKPTLYGEPLFVMGSYFRGTANGGTVDMWEGVKFGSEYLPKFWMPMPDPPPYSWDQEGSDHG